MKYKLLSRVARIPARYPSFPDEEIDRVEFYRNNRLDGIHDVFPDDTVSNIALIIRINLDLGRRARIVLKSEV